MRSYLSCARSCSSPSRFRVRRSRHRSPAVAIAEASARAASRSTRARRSSSDGRHHRAPRRRQLGRRLPVLRSLAWLPARRGVRHRRARLHRSRREPVARAHADDRDVVHARSATAAAARTTRIEDGDYRLVVKTCDGASSFTGPTFHFRFDVSPFVHAGLTDDVSGVTVARADLPAKGYEPGAPATADRIAGLVVRGTPQAIDTKARDALLALLRDGKGFTQDVDKRCKSDHHVAFSLSRAPGGTRVETVELTIDFTCNRVFAAYGGGANGPRAVASAFLRSVARRVARVREAGAAERHRDREGALVRALILAAAFSFGACAPVAAEPAPALTITNVKPGAFKLDAKSAVKLKTLASIESLRDGKWVDVSKNFDVGDGYRLVERCDAKTRLRRDRRRRVAVAGPVVGHGLQLAVQQDLRQERAATGRRLPARRDELRRQGDDRRPDLPLRRPAALVRVAKVQPRVDRLDRGELRQQERRRRRGRPRSGDSRAGTRAPPPAVNAIEKLLAGVGDHHLAEHVATRSSPTPTPPSTNTARRSKPPAEPDVAAAAVELEPLALGRRRDGRLVARRRERRCRPRATRTDRGRPGCRARADRGVGRGRRQERRPRRGRPRRTSRSTPGARSAAARQSRAPERDETARPSFIGDRDRYAAIGGGAGNHGRAWIGRDHRQNV